MKIKKHWPSWSNKLFSKKKMFSFLLFTCNVIVVENIRLLLSYPNVWSEWIKKKKITLHHHHTYFKWQRCCVITTYLNLLLSIIITTRIYDFRIFCCFCFNSLFIKIDLSTTIEWQFVFWRNDKMRKKLFKKNKHCRIIIFHR